MFKISKKKLIITLVAVTAVGGISTKTLPMFHNVNTTIKKAQTSNIKDAKIDSQNAHKNDTDKDSNSLSDAKNSSDNNQNNNDNTNKQETISSKLEKSSNNNDTNKQTTASSQSKDTNSNVNTESQGSINTVRVPTIHYDRITSIYADDKITLLRREYYINNKLTYYSDIEQFDASTKSYIEKIYQCNLETNIDPFIRTDVYINGNLIKSY